MFNEEQWIEIGRCAHCGDIAWKLGDLGTKIIWSTYTDECLHEIKEQKDEKGKGQTNPH